MPAIQKVNASCAGMDHGVCGITVSVQDGQIIGIKGDANCPHGSRGYICAKGLAAAERIASKERLTKPLKRKGPRGSGDWEEVNWDEALDLVASNLNRVKQQYGAEAVTFMQGSAKGLEYMLLFRFAHAFGSPNVSAPSSICFIPRVGASIITCGFYPIPDYAGNPSCVLVWGSNVTVTNADGIPGAEVLGAIRKGAKLIVVDPRKTPLAKRADLWLPLKPGSDSVLAMGILKVIVEQGWYDEDFVNNWTVGFEDLKIRLDSYSYESIEKATWVSKDKIEAVARIYTENRPGCLQWGNGIDQSTDTVQTIRALLILSAISGNLEAPGGDIRPPGLRLMKSGDFTLNHLITASTKPIISSKYKMARMFNVVPYQLTVEAMLSGRPYPIKAAYLQANNPLLTFPDSNKTYQALNELEFLVVADLFMTPTAALADVVLPVAARLEYDDLGFYAHPSGRLVARPKVIEPRPECRSDSAILSQLARRLGFGELFWNSEEECIDAILAPSGITFQQLKQDLVLQGETRYYTYKSNGFRTPSGKFEIASGRLEKWGQDALPSALLDFPETNEEYPLVLTSGKSPYYFHSSNRNLASLRKREPEPVVEINPATAEGLGIVEGDMVSIRTSLGAIKQRARINPDVHPGVVIASFGWWFPEKGIENLFDWKDSNLNILTSAEPPYDPVVGSVRLRGIPCAVNKQ